MTFASIAAIILPVFALVGIGFFASRFSWLAAGTGEGLSDFVFVIAVPVLVFKTLVTADLPASIPWGLWAAYFLGVLVAWGFGATIARRIAGMSAEMGVIAGVGASFANTVMIGIPLTLTAFGRDGTVPLFLIISVHLPIMMVAGTVAIERASRTDGKATGSIDVLKLGRQVAFNLAQNPIAIAILIAGAFRLAGIGIPAMARGVMDLLGQAAIPTALIAMGMSVHRYGRVRDLGPALGLSMLKLVVMPAVVFAAARYLFALPPLWVAVATLTAACPAGINVHLIANRFQIGQGLAASSISVSTALAIPALWIWLAVIGPV